MRVLSIVHLDSDPPGLFGEVVAARDHEHDEWLIRSGSPPPSDPPEAYDALALFGGDMAVVEEEQYPFLREEKEHLRNAVAQGVPVLGVCLGGQLLADVAGARVTLARRPEIGWYDVELLPAAADDRLFHDLPARFPAFQWHSWEFELPPGAVPLAGNDVCLQAYRLGDRAWGVQFHPEPTPEMLAHWIEAAASHSEARRIGFDVASERAASERNVAQWNRIGRALFSRFLESAEARADATARLQARATA